MPRYRTLEYQVEDPVRNSAGPALAPWASLAAVDIRGRSEPRTRDYANTGRVGPRNVRDHRERGAAHRRPVPARRPARHALGDARTRRSEAPHQSTGFSVGPTTWPCAPAASS